MLATLIKIYTYLPGNENDGIYITKINSINWTSSIKDMYLKCEVKIPIKNITYEGDKIIYGDYTINLYDYIEIDLTYDGYLDYDKIKGNRFVGYITNFIFNKEYITIEIENLSFLLKQMKRIKFSQKNATMLDILTALSDGYDIVSNDKEFTFEIKLDDNRSINIKYDNFDYTGTFQIKDPLSPFEILKLIKEDLGINIFESNNILYIGTRISDNEVIKYSYPYLTGYNFVIDVDIEQYTNDLTKYIIKAKSAKSSTTSIKVAYDITGYVEYTTEKDNTINLEFPNVSETTLKKIVLNAWDKLDSDKQKRGSFITFGIPGTTLDNDIILNLYGEESKYIVEGVDVSFDVNSGIRQNILLGKKLSS